MSLARSARVPPRAIPQPTKSSRTASSQLPTAPSQEMPQTAILRYTVLGLVVLAALVAFGSWVVRRRRVSPFGVLGRALRAITGLVVITAVAGIVFLSLASWFVTTFQTVYAAASGGPRATFALIIDLAYRILFVALIVRVVAAWFGMFRYSRWIRPAYILTDWIVEPVRRIVPLVGAFDFSPVVAMIVLSLLRQILLSALSR